MYRQILGCLCISWCLSASAGVLQIRRNTPEAGFDRRHNNANPRRQALTVDCPSCAWLPITVDNDYDRELSWPQQHDRRLILDFSISQDGQRLQLDGVPIYPSESYQAASHGGLPIYIEQLAIPRKFDAEADAVKNIPLELTSFGLVVTEYPSSSSDVEDDADDRILHVGFQITSLERQTVDAQVAVTILKSGDSELSLLSVDPVTDDPRLTHDDQRLAPGPVEAYEQTTCSGLPATVCRFREAIARKLNDLRHSQFGAGRPCRRPQGTHPPPGAERWQDFKPPHGPEHHSWHHGPHHHGHHPRPLSHAIVKLFIAVLIPVMAGITTGLCVSLVGLFLGRLVGSAYISFQGNRERHSRPRRAGRRKSSRTALMDEEAEPLPLYEHAPAYEEREGGDRDAL